MSELNIGSEFINDGVGIGTEGISVPPDAAYEGPLDLVPGAVVAYGVRALSAAMRGENLFRLKRTSDNAEMDFASDSTTGNAPVSEITTWLGGSNGHVAKWYDQSGNAVDLLGDGTTSSPQFIANAVNGKCGLKDIGVSVVSTATVGISSGGVTAFSVAEYSQPDGIGGGNIFIDNASNGTISFTVNPLGGIVTMNDGAGHEAGGAYSSLAADVSGFYISDTICEYANNQVVLNGTSPAENNNYDVSGPLSAFSNCTVLINSNGIFNNEEYLVWDGIKASNLRLAVRQNIAAYYGITLS